MAKKSNYGGSNLDLGFKGNLTRRVQISHLRPHHTNRWPWTHPNISKWSKWKNRIMGAPTWTWDNLNRTMPISHLPPRKTTLKTPNPHGAHGVNRTHHRISRLPEIAKRCFRRYWSLRARICVHFVGFHNDSVHNVNVHNMSVNSVNAGNYRLLDWLLPSEIVLPLIIAI